MAEMTVPLVDQGNGLWGSPSAAWDHLINRESSGRPEIIQQIIDVNSGGNEAEGLFQITPATWRRHNGTDFAPTARLATPQQQAIVAARIFIRNPSGSDWGAGRPGREDARELMAGLVPVDGATDGGNDVGGFTGDPVWLADVLHDWLGDRLVVEDGWADRGTGGTMGDIWGVLIHHTGNSRETVGVIENGRSDLAGPLSQGLITPDGKFHLVAVGPCNHAGIGSYPGIGVNNGNQRLIGFECAWPDIRPDGSYDAGQRWPDAQVQTMRDATAGVLSFLKYDSSHCIGHKEWATKPPNVKWDPGNMDMDRFFRPEVQKAINGQFRNKPTPPPVPLPPAPSPTNIPANSQAIEYFAACAYWEQLGWHTQVEMLREIGIALKILPEDVRSKTGVSLVRPE
jgi:hypothetical protein